MGFNKALFDSNFGFPFRVSVATNMHIATKAFEAFLNSNAQFLSDADELYGRLLSHAVKHQFLKSAPTTANCYFVSGTEVNMYRTSAVFLNTADYITHICRTNKPYELPCKAHYKLQLALGNREDDQQLEFSFSSSQNSPLIIPPKHYALLTYCYKNGELRHLTLAVPDSHFESITYSENLLGQISEHYQYVPEEIVEESITSLKNDIALFAQNREIIGE